MELHAGPQVGASGLDDLTLTPLLQALREMPLDPRGVAEVTLDAAEGLGYRASALIALREDGSIETEVLRRGELPAQTDRAIETAVSTGESFVAGPCIASPVWTEGWLSAVLVGVGERTSPAQVALFELLAAMAGAAVRNAQRFDLERRAVERLEEFDSMKTDFLATISHELRTPVTAIQGMARLLQDSWQDLDDATREEFLQTLNRRTTGLDRILVGLLEFSDVQSARVQMNFEALDVRAMIEAAVGRCRLAFPERLVHRDVHGDPLAWADRGLIDRILDHLLSNAMQHTPDGTDVVISAEQHEDGVRIAVQDDGPGMATEDIDLVGESFHRGGDLNERTNGVGLGLALVTEILAAHERRLDVRSEPGGGTCCSFVLAASSPG